MTSNRFSATMLLGGVLLSGTTAHARCDVNLSAPGQVRFQGNSGNGYESFDAARYEAEFLVTVENEGAQTCNGLISVQRTEGVDGLRGQGPRDLTYSISPPGWVSTIVDDQIETGRPPNAISLAVPPGQSRTQRLTLQIPARQVVSSGSYSSTVLVRFLDATDLEVSAERNVELVTNVRPTMSIMLFDTALPSVSSVARTGTRNYQMDFGILETGEQAAVTVLVQSNDDYSLRFSSPNRGALTHITRGDQYRIPYTASFAGRELNLAAGEIQIAVSPATSISGSSRQLNVRIGDIGIAHAGRYEDEITITVLPAG